MKESNETPEVVWRPQTPGETPMDHYRRHINERFSTNLRTSHELQRWSVTNPHDFWIDLHSWLRLTPALPKDLTKAYDDTVPMSSNPPFFPGYEMNYAENALFSNPDPNSVALVGVREGMDLANDDGAQLTWHEYRERVRLTASALKNRGIKRGDRVCALVATSIWAVVLFNAAASLGAIFTSISPELGLEGCVSRLQQVTPSILFADGDTVYKGKTTSTASKISQIVSRLQAKPQTYIIPIISAPKFPTIDTFLSKSNINDPLTFTRVPFTHPLLIAYSSGTTGTPKCIVHHHGTILQFKKIAALHNSTTPSDTILQYSSTSWIVFYVMAGYTACGAKTILYNGSPMHPSPTAFLSLAAKHRATYLGTSPRYLLELETARSVPKRDFDLSALRLVYTTGATLSPAQYRWFYAAFPPAVHLVNTAGGTDTASSLIAGDPTAPVHAGEMQLFALGTDVDVADSETGESILRSGEAGEMVIRKPFPSMPCFFWGDDGGARYRESYFEKFEGVDCWAQHDWLSWNGRTGGLVMHGRSDGVLNPSGIRFGSGEIYAIVEAPPFNTLISSTLCVGRRRPSEPDEAVFLFVVMHAGYTLESGLKDQLRAAIKTGLSARHVPRFIFEVPEIPVTINGKKVEVAVKKVLGGGKVVPSATVANPGAIHYFERFGEVESEARAAKL